MKAKLLGLSLAAGIPFGCGTIGEPAAVTDGAQGGIADSATEGNGEDKGSGQDLAEGNDGSPGGSDAGDDGDGLADDKCVGTFAEAVRVPAVIQAVVDTSTSMSWDAPEGTSSRWEATRGALVGALERLSETAPNTAFGISFFPNLAIGCYDPEQHAPIYPLSEIHLEALRAELMGASTEGGTPTHGAYHFSLGELRSSGLSGNRFMLLITDGQASFGMTDFENPGWNCSGNGKDAVDVTELIAEVGSAFTAEDIRTFVIGVPGSDGFEASLSEMASVGGTGEAGCTNAGPNYCHFDMNAQSNLANSLGAALEEITGKALGCVYAIPDPPDNQQLNFDEVNVVYTPSSGSPERILRDGETNCTDGWQYSPDQSQVLLCGPTCERVKAEGGRVEIEFGCTQSLR